MASKILIVEDDVFTTENVADTLRQNDFDPLIAHSAKEAWAQFVAHKPDLVLMDIELKDEIDGIELAAKMNQHIKTPVIYLTDKKDERIVQKAQNIHHAYYMDKPFREAILLSQINLALKQNKSIAPAEVKALYIKERANESKKVKVLYDQICYLKAARSYCELYYCQDENTLVKKIEISKNMATILEKLPPGQFAQVHRSYAVNIERIEAFDSKDITVCGTAVPIGENYKVLVSELLNQA